MAGVTDYLAKIVELTNTNVKLLKALNNSFYTDKDHLRVDMGEEGTFVIPSFVTLENKINLLESNFQNLVNAPKTSEAHFTFDGNSRVIEVMGYEQSPNPISLKTQEKFYHENANVFKDFLTPVPFLKFDVSELPNNLTSVSIRKVVALSDRAKQTFANIIGDEVSVEQPWGDLWKILDGMESGVDYEMYDTVQKLPVRTGQGYGNYVIREIIEDDIDENLDQFITLRFANDINGYQNTLSYLLFDQTMERYLKPGDYLVNWDASCKFEVTELNFNTNVIKLKVLFGDYANLFAFAEGTENIPDNSKMRFFSKAGLFDDENYVKVPLEENRYIFVAVAPLNDRMNIRAPWGSGLMVDVYQLTNIDDESQEFLSYYDNCKNIGDILYEVANVMSNTTSKHTNQELNDFMSAKPEIDPTILKVTHINKHLDESTTIQNIRALYAQKNTYNADLTETQNSITTLEDQLATVDFQDTTGIRTTIQNQINELTTHKNDLINALIKISDEIALVANNSVVPIENAKYRIRGFFDFVNFANSLKDEGHNITEENIKGIHVEYRYRNAQREIGSAETFVKDVNGNGQIDGEDTIFVFSDWNVLDTPLRPRVRNTDGTYSAEEDTSSMNVPSFNQIDIPITQGESVDVRLKVIYDFGYPFIQMMSAWSDIVVYEFPEEFMKDVQILDIISENNNDIETNRFNTILNNHGVIAHVDDHIIDQDTTYFHKPESIASGFYTEERRIIPLRDKLQDMNNLITQLMDEVAGTAADQLAVSFMFDESSIDLTPFEMGNVLLKEFQYFVDKDPGKDGNYIVVHPDNTPNSYKYVSIACAVRLINTSKHTMKIFSMFPGTDNALIEDLNEYKVAFKKDDFTGVAYMDKDHVFRLQTTNQVLTFRNDDPYTNEKFYYHPSSDTPQSAQALAKENNKLWMFEKEGNNYGSIQEILNGLNPSSSSQEIVTGMCVYPYTYNDGGLKMTSKEAYSYMLLDPNEEVVIPIVVEYSLDTSTTSTTISSIEKTITFDIRTSLYKDPLHYSVNIAAKYLNTPQDKLVSTIVQYIGEPTQTVRPLRYTSVVE